MAGYGGGRNALAAMAPPTQQSTPTILAMLRDALSGYFDRQGQLARGGLAQADLGAQQMREGNLLSGGLNMALGPAGYVTSPINALMPSTDTVYDAARNTKFSPEAASLLAGGVGMMAMGLPGPKGGKVAHAAEEGITAYHGSPHTFDKFDMSKIGTGEGAQAYGHGLYFAESPTVAGYYREGLTKQGVNVEYKGKPFQGREWEKGQQYDGSPQAALESVQAYGGVDQAIGEIKKGLKAMASRGGKFQDDPFVKAQQQRLEFLQANRADIAVKPQGATYQVRLNVKPDELLDWDRPLSEQPEGVRKALEPFVGKSAPFEQSPGVWQIGAHSVVHDAPTGKYLLTKGSAIKGRFGSLDDAVSASGEQRTGAQLYESARLVPGEVRDQVAASAKLKAAGIKGIRYKDAGSRSGEGGTYNYVIFDDKLVDILKRYGIPFTVGAGGAAMVAGQGLPPEVASQLEPQT